MEFSRAEPDTNGFANRYENWWVVITAENGLSDRVWSLYCIGT